MLPNLLLSSLLAGTATATPLLARRHSSGIPFSSRSIPINGAIPRSSTEQTLSKRWTGTDVQLSGPLGGTIYTIPITIGTQNFTVRIDTGSADLWVHAHNVTCPASAAETTGLVGNPNDVTTDPSANITAPQPDANSTTCYFKSGGYDPSLNPNFHELPYANNYNQSFSGGMASGFAALDDVTLAGITVPQQEFAIVDVAGPIWGNVGTNDGLFGLAGPSITVVYDGADGTQDTPDKLRAYNPWLYTAANQSLIDPYFTINLGKPTFEQRTLTYDNITDYGTLTIGGVPEDAPLSDTSVTVPNSGIPSDLAPGGTFFYWAVNVTSYDFPGSESIPAENNTSPFALLDTGTGISQLPPAIVEAWHKSIDPPGQLIQGSWTVQCNATIPDLGITVGGQKFVAKGDNFRTGLPYTTPEAGELIGQLGGGQLDGQCLSGVQLSLGGSNAVAIIGDNFLWDNMFIGDLEKNEITLIQKAES